MSRHRSDHKSPNGPRGYNRVDQGPHVDASLPISTRMDELLAERIRYGLRHPHTKDAILLDLTSARVLLARLEAE